jgi:Tol biopolymer transport system component
MRADLRENPLVLLQKGEVVMSWNNAVRPLGMIVVAGLGVGCVAPQSTTQTGRTYDDQYMRIGRVEGYVDNSGMHFRIDPSEEFREVAEAQGVSTEALSQLVYGTGGGRGVNPSGTYELVTCRSATSPACSVQYGPTIEPVAYAVGDSGYAGACGTIPGGASTTCFAADVELRQALNVELANVYIAFNSTTSAAGDNVVLPYGGTTNTLGIGSSLNSTTYRYGSLEPGPVLGAGTSFDSPFHQASLRRWRFSYPEGTTDFSFTFRGDVYATIATQRAPYAASVTATGDETTTEFHAGCISDNGDVHVGVAIEPVSDTPQVFWHRRRTGELRWVSRDITGELGAGSTEPDAVGHACVSANGDLVVFDSRYPLTPTDTDPATLDVYAYTVSTGDVEFISHFGSGSAVNCGGAANVGSLRPAVSDSGRYIAFESTCSDFCAGAVGCATGRSQVYRFDRGEALLEGISMTDESDTDFGTAHSTFASISADGMLVSFQSQSTNLTVPSETGATIDVFVRDVPGVATTRITDNVGNGYFASQLSRDGAFVVFVSKSNAFVPGITDSNDLDVFRCTSTGTGCEYVSLANGSTTESPEGDSGATTIIGASISPDGNIIAFESVSEGLVTDTNLARDIFVRDMTSDVTTRISVDSFGSESDGPSMSPHISTNASGAHYVSFESAATNLMFDASATGAFDSNDGSASDVFSVRL